MTTDFRCDMYYLSKSIKTTYGEYIIYTIRDTAKASLIFMKGVVVMARTLKEEWYAQVEKSIFRDAILDQLDQETVSEITSGLIKRAKSDDRSFNLLVGMMKEAPGQKLDIDANVQASLSPAEKIEAAADFLQSLTE